MPSQILATTAVASLTPVLPTVTILAIVHTMATAPSGTFWTVDALEVMLESDIDASFKSYVTPYNNAAFAGGSMKYAAIKSISDLSVLTKKNGKPIALKKTTGTITCTVVTPAVNPTGTPDPVVTYDLDFAFTFAGQTWAESD